MRQIKFRGQTIGGEWVTGNLSILKKDFSTVRKGHYISNSAGAPFAFMVRPETVGQYVGKVGANACEVWEGDKVIATLNHQGKPTGIKFSAFISFNEHVGTWQIKYKNYKGNYVSDDIGFRYFLEVIGNTHTQDGGQEG